ncbi:NAD(P)-dependent oxidoreductase [Salinicoccus sp. ID82-1]|uniref:NAD(P)H-dependent oxidoreductase n=1 Tax=Salinicoccus sp. ID82-1 TaxID=2820269 RepID=UPI001F3542DB|nr:NAD(P)-dependent oxidoreductase [Salinicoccus sp. ID82-1]MCG1009553.1 NAD(P)-dependent oxidoreductase [Salinicoccus sp. ID82-1]
MLGVNRELKQLQESGKHIGVGLVGAGQMGRGMISQIASMNGMKVVATADINLDSITSAYRNAGLEEADIATAENKEDADKAIAEGRSVALTDAGLMSELDGVDVVVDATGVPEVGASVAIKAIENKKHIVMLNVEADITIGYYLYRLAEENGVIYTGSAGDEPGAIMELYDFADALGFDVVALGKGKNNPLNLEANPDSVKEVAKEKGSSPKMIASFQDGTKTMVEMNAVANATGYVPDIPGMHGFSGGVKDLPEIFRLEADGGKVQNKYIVEYINGVAPGVFIIIASDKEEVNAELKYLSMGPGPNYVLYRPYHLTSLETPLSIAKAYLSGTPTIAPYKGMVAETVTVAKIDLKKGDHLDSIGGYTVYGQVYKYEEAKAQDALPIGLVNSNLVLQRDIAKGEVITYADVEGGESSLIWELRRKQDELLKK